MMRKSLYAGSTAALLVILIPAVAGAGDVRQRGEIKGADGSKVTLTIVKRNGEVKAVKGFDASGVPAKCEKGASTNWKASFEFPGSIPVGARKTRFDRKFSIGSDASFRVKGRVRNNGRKVKGRVAGSFDGGDFGDCRIPKQRFVTKKR